MPEGQWGTADFSEIFTDSVLLEIKPERRFILKTIWCSVEGATNVTVKLGSEVVHIFRFSAKGQFTINFGEGCRYGGIYSGLKSKAGYSLKYSNSAAVAGTIGFFGSFQGPRVDS